MRQRKVHVTTPRECSVRRYARVRCGRLSRRRFFFAPAFFRRRFACTRDGVPPPSEPDSDSSSSEFTIKPRRLPSSSTSRSFDPVMMRKICPRSTLAPVSTGEKAAVKVEARVVVHQPQLQLQRRQHQMEAQVVVHQLQPQRRRLQLHHRRIRHRRRHHQVSTSNVVADDGSRTHQGVLRIEGPYRYT